MLGKGVWYGAVYPGGGVFLGGGGGGGQSPPSTGKQTPSTPPPPEMVPVAAGTHPTGMHSCLIFQSQKWINSKYNVVTQKRNPMVGPLIVPVNPIECFVCH